MSLPNKIHELEERLEYLENREPRRSRNEVRRSEGLDEERIELPHESETRERRHKEWKQPSSKSRKARYGKRSPSPSNDRDTEISEVEETAPMGRREGMHRAGKGSRR